MNFPLRRARAATAPHRNALGLGVLGVAAILGAAAAGTVQALAETAITEATSRTAGVTVYPDGARVTRVIEVDLAGGEGVVSAGDFPAGLDPASLRVEAVATTPLTIGAIDARPPRAADPPAGLDDDIEALRDERTRLDGRIEAATARRKFVESFAKRSPAMGEKGEPRSLEEWKAAFAAVEDEVASAEKAIGEARVQQRDIDRKLKRLEAEHTRKPPHKMEVRIGVSAAAATHATLAVSYNVRGARWTPLYDARLDSGKGGRSPALEVVRRAEIVQGTGEDWTDVGLTVSTSRTVKGGSAPELRPLVVGPPPVTAATPQAVNRAAPAAPPAPRVFGFVGGGTFDGKPKNDDAGEADIAVEEAASADTGGFDVVWRIPGRVTIAANEGARNLRIAAMTIAPDLSVHATPSRDTTAFLQAAFRDPEDAPLLPGQVSIYRDGAYVGRSAMAMTAKDGDVRLGFGADDGVRIERTTVGQVDGSIGLIMSSKTARREFRTTVRNGHDGPVHVVLEDQVPVSESDDVKVEVLALTTPPSDKDVRGRRGVMAWNLDLKPGETRDVRIGWQVRWPSDQTVIYTTGN